MSRYAHLAFTDTVRGLQREHGSDRAYAAQLRTPVDEPDVLGERETGFLAARDGFYLATVGETGWPYVQYRGGPPGFVHVLGGRTFAFADVRGNRQYLTTGNLATDDRVAAFFMDYAGKARLKILGHASVRDAADVDPAVVERLCARRTDGTVERVVTVTVEGLNWNCPQHITPRYTAAELSPLLERLTEAGARNAELQRDNDALRARLGEPARQ